MSQPLNPWGTKRKVMVEFCTTQATAESVDWPRSIPSPSILVWALDGIVIQGRTFYSDTQVKISFSLEATVFGNVKLILFARSHGILPWEWMAPPKLTPFTHWKYCNTSGIQICEGLTVTSFVILLAAIPSPCSKPLNQQHTGCKKSGALPTASASYSPSGLEELKGLWYTQIPDPHVDIAGDVRKIADLQWRQNGGLASQVNFVSPNKILHWTRWKVLSCARSSPWVELLNFRISESCNLDISQTARQIPFPSCSRG